MKYAGYAKVYDHKAGAWLDVPCELTIDAAQLIQALGAKAVHSKGKCSKLLHGLVTVKVLPS